MGREGIDKTEIAVQPPDEHTVGLTKTADGAAPKTYTFAHESGEVATGTAEKARIQCPFLGKLSVQEAGLLLELQAIGIDQMAKDAEKTQVQAKPEKKENQSKDIKIKEAQKSEIETGQNLDKKHEVEVAALAQKVHAEDAPVTSAEAKVTPNDSALDTIDLEAAAREAQERRSREVLIASPETLATVKEDFLPEAVETEETLTEVIAHKPATLGRSEIKPEGATVAAIAKEEIIVELKPAEPQSSIEGTLHEPAEVQTETEKESDEVHDLQSFELADSGTVDADDSLEEIIEPADLMELPLLEDEFFDETASSELYNWEDTINVLGVADSAEVDAQIPQPEAALAPPETEAIELFEQLSQQIAEMPEDEADTAHGLVNEIMEVIQKIPEIEDYQPGDTLEVDHTEALESLLVELFIFAKIEYDEEHIASLVRIISTNKHSFILEAKKITDSGLRLSEEGMHEALPRLISNLQKLKNSLHATQTLLGKYALTLAHPSQPIAALAA